MTSPYYAADMATLYHGDRLDVLADLPDCSIDAVVSWEPYGDTPVKAGISRGGLLIPTGWAEP